MLFELSNYWIFLAILAAIYVAIVTLAQNNIGGKNRLKNLQLEMREIQKRMTGAAKSKDDAVLNEAVSQNWKLTMEIMVIQVKMFAVIIGILLVLGYVFPLVEPGTQDDVRLQLFDDGLAAHCDAKAGDGIFSSCYSLPADGVRGAWVIDAYMNSSQGELLARQGAAIYYEGGKPEDVWLQSFSQSGLLDGLSGKKPYVLNVTTDKQDYKTGETVSVHALSTPPVVPQAVKLEAVADSGTFFHVDLPFALPLINIRRIIGSYGVFLFLAFVLGMLYSIGKSLYSSVSKK